MRSESRNWNTETMQSGRSSMESHTSVRTASDLPESWICGPYPGIFTLGINCSDVRTTVNVFEVELKGTSLVALQPPPLPAPTHQHHHHLPTTNERPGCCQDQSSNWTLHISPGRDRHEQNLEVVRSHVTGETQLRTVREIRKGEELFVWYSEELARELSIPILTPANIQGNLEYTCTACSASFQYPNPLKAHIRFHCHRQSASRSSDSSHLIGRTASDVPRRQSSESSLQMTSLGSTTKSREGVSQSRMERLELGTPEKSQFPHQPPGCRGSRVQDDLRRPDLVALNYMSQFLLPPDPHRYPFFPLRFPFLPGFLPWGGLHPLAPFRDHANPTERFYPPVDLSSLADAASVSAASKNSEEELFSSTTPIDVDLGEGCDDPAPRMVIRSNGRKSKCGYLCVYCGKLYSRKYGLKIHVRTHTGFKPLKCKVCLRPFGDPSNLNKHTRLHAEGDTPYRCHHCGKVLVRRRDLERHIRSRHSNEVVTFSDNLSDDNATAVTSSVSLLDEQDVDVEDTDPISVV